VNWITGSGLFRRPEASERLELA